MQSPKDVHQNIFMDPKLNHLLLRAGFGTQPKAISRLGWKSPADALPSLFRTDDFSITLPKGTGSDRSKVDKSKIREQTVAMNLEWLIGMAESKSPLQEKMCFFWHDHFGVKAKLPVLAAIHNNTLRKYALGKFGDLLHAVAKDPAMLLFLNNQQNKKSAPNENFARELFELFTLGEGHYTESDIKEAARAFTGWKTDRQGAFRFVRFQHDYGAKTVFGKRKNFTGEQVVDLVLQQPQTAKFIVDKIVDFMVGPQLDQAKRSDLYSSFRRSDLHIGKLLQEIFTSDWFYAQEHRAARIKSPIELLVSVCQAFDLKKDSGIGLLMAQRSLGQVLFAPPSVAGWPSERQWIDSSSLLYRQNLGFAVLLNRALKGIEKANFDAKVKGMDLPKGSKLFSASTRYWQGLSTAACSEILFAKPPSQQVLAQIDRAAGAESTPELMRLALLMALPEYQLC
ncbi:DUF1800 domain-containing protein [Gilvibacter sediminis]|uniref:DUF1800 domain-containing protein n=1 Tax=Gilvibacter sediminis TaxID=379071 RepID=UPI0023508425|nr:DUF1800 domain-containing protein [Gilvibacter sediminis]MDC7998847.1 DUF1800 domain-containing protein [Gilvibacter sediminis]